MARARLVTNSTNSSKIICNGRVGRVGQGLGLRA
jgi:hypothetical protein